MTYLRAAILLIFVASSFAAPMIISDVIPNMIGVNIHFTSPLEGELEAIKEAGMRILRMLDI